MEISAARLAAALGITQKSAWFMLHRIRLAMHGRGTSVQIGGQGREVEVDETFIGGKARNMQRQRRGKRESRISRQNMKTRSPLWGCLERGGKVRTAVVRSVDASALARPRSSRTSKPAARSIPTMRCPL